MKRLAIAGVLFCIILGVCISNHFMVKNCCERMVFLIEECESAFEEGDAEAVATAKELQRQWEEYTPLLSLFVSRAVIEEIGISIARIPPYAATGSRDSFFGECSAAKKMLFNMRDEERISLIGIL